jgi:CheY-like chemotaxis protein
MAYILVIDDSLDIRSMLNEILTIDGHTVDTADNGRSAMTLAGRCKYDLVITDILMPVMDGLEVIGELSRKSPDTRVIAMSGGVAGMESDYLLSTASLMRADKVLSKPFSLGALNDAIKDVLSILNATIVTAPLTSPE